MMKERPKQRVTPLLSGSCIAQKRSELLAYFENTWLTYESLFALITEDHAFYLRPEPLRHPLIFYYGHTATFFINKLLLGKYIQNRVDPQLEAICAVGVDEMSWDDLDSNHYDWPDVSHVRQYRKSVYKLVQVLIKEMPLNLPITQDSLAWIILMGCEHERIHLETSSVLMRMLPLDYLRDNCADWPACSEFGAAPENALITVAAQQIRLGKQACDATYGWDNEYGVYQEDVAQFSASCFLVSNAEYLSFVQAGGYENNLYWSEEGKSWLAYSQTKMPRFWSKINGKYYQRNLLAVVPLPMNWPVEVNYLEAHAFCQWKSEQLQTNIHLPTEAQWYCLRQNVEGDITDWQEIPANTNLTYYASSCPVNRFSHGEFFDICGNVWQWTASPIDGFEGFNVHPMYDDFSTPTFDGKHNLIKGGSWISTGNEALWSSRYAFRRHFFQHAGFRYVQSDSNVIPVSPVRSYETDTDICQELASHYLIQNNNVIPFAKQLADLIAQNLCENVECEAKLLNYGCGCGRTAFELATKFRQIDAVDMSARTIQHAVALQQEGATRFTTIHAGDIVNYHEIRLAALGLHLATDNLHFTQGDITNLKQAYSDYDVIVVQQALERSYYPKQALLSCLSRLKVGGILVIASDLQFSETYTDKSLWLGGRKVNGENLLAEDGIHEVLISKAKMLSAHQLTEQIPVNNSKRVISDIAVQFWQKHCE